MADGTVELSRMLLLSSKGTDCRLRLYHRWTTHVIHFLAHRHLLLLMLGWLLILILIEVVRSRIHHLHLAVALISIDLFTLSIIGK